MMIECEVKSGQTVESIKHTRREGGDEIGVKFKLKMVEGRKCGCGMMIECEVKTDQTVESIKHTRREGGDGVGVKINERGN